MLISGRYNHFAMQLNDCGFKVYAMDWIGKQLSTINLFSSMHKINVVDDGVKLRSEIYAR